MTTNRLPLVLAAILLALSFSVPAFRFVTSPPGQVFSGIQFYSDDYAVYAHTVMQGIRGRWTVVDKFTSEPHPGSLFHIQYLLLGKAFGPPVGVILSILNPHIPVASAVYHLSRLIFGSLVLWAAWQFVKELDPGPVGSLSFRLSAWILILFSGIFSKNLFPPTWPNLEPFFREPDVFTRFASQPHFLAGSLALLVTLTIFLKSLSQKVLNRNSLSLIFVLSFLVGWTDPSTILTTITILSIYTLLTFLISPSLSKIEIPVLFSLTVTVALLPSVVYFRFLRTTEPWLTIAAFDSTQNFNLMPEDFLPTFGLPLLLAPLGLFLLFKTRRTAAFLILSWLSAFILLFYFFAPILSINRLRLFHPPVFIAIDLLAAYAIFRLSSYLIHKLELKLRLTVLSCCLLITGLVILPTIPSSIASLRGQLKELTDYSTLVYPSVTTVEAFNYLKDNSSESSVVAAMYEAGSMLPYFTGNTSFAGNLSETLNYGQKSNDLSAFLAGKMTPETAEEFLIRSKIDYIFWGPQEKSAGGKLLQYPYLKVVYSNTQIDILKFTPDPS